MRSAAKNIPQYYIIHAVNQAIQQIKATRKKNKAAKKVTTGSVVVSNTCAQPTNTCTLSGSPPLMTILPVLVKAKNSSTCIATYAFTDNGCGAVFLADELHESLHTRSKKTKLLLKTMNLEHEFDTEIVQDELQVGNVDGSTFIGFAKRVCER